MNRRAFNTAADSAAPRDVAPGALRMTSCELGSTANHVECMLKAIEVARANPLQPFGAVIVDSRTNAVVSEGVNRSDAGPIWHAEIVAIESIERGVCDWSDTRLYTTAEPCAMCQSAILWAGIPDVIYGVSIPQLRALGWRQPEFRVRCWSW